jgi:phage/plasmid-like protein (TIGR03299 family)
MVHNLAESNGRTAMMYAGQVPWHRLGTKLENPATAEEAIVAAGLGYDVTLADLQTTENIYVPFRKAVIRTDNSAVLGVVGKGYQPIQNKECFGFLDSVVADGGLRYHTAGALGKGERIWLLAKLPDQIRIKESEDVTDKYLLLSNSHDGTSSLRVFFTPIRVVCQNTLNLADRRGTGQGISIMHKGDLATKVEEAREVLGLARRFFDDFEVKADILAHTYPTSAQVELYFKNLFPDPEQADPSRAQSTREELTRLFEEGMGQQIPEIRHTMWAALNAVTEYVDHHRSTRGRTDGDRAGRRLASAWFGTGAKMKHRGLSLAVDFAVSS